MSAHTERARHRARSDLPVPCWPFRGLSITQKGCGAVDRSRSPRERPIVGDRFRSPRRWGTIFGNAGQDLQGLLSLHVITTREHPKNMELDCRGAELRFQVLTEREEENSVASASLKSLRVQCPGCPGCPRSGERHGKGPGERGCPRRLRRRDHTRDGKTMALRPAVTAQPSVRVAVPVVALVWPSAPTVWWSVRSRGSLRSSPE